MGGENYILERWRGEEKRQLNLIPPDLVKRFVECDEGEVQGVYGDLLAYAREQRLVLGRPLLEYLADARATRHQIKENRKRFWPASRG